MRREASVQPKMLPLRQLVRMTCMLRQVRHDFIHACACLEEATYTKLILTFTGKVKQLVRVPSSCCRRTGQRLVLQQWSSEYYIRCNVHQILMIHMTL